MLLAGACVLPIALMSGIGLQAVFEQQRAQAQRAALDVARALSTAIDGELGRTISALEIVASSEPLDVGDLAAFDERLRRVARTQPAWITAILSDTEGRQLINTALPPGSPLPATVEAQSLLEVVRTAKPVVGYLAAGRSGAWAVPVRVPVIRNGTVRYVLTVPIQPQSLVDIVLRQRPGEGSVVTVVDAKGQRVVRWPKQDEYIGTPVSSSLAALMAEGPEGTGVTVTTEGTAVYTAFSRSPRSRWSVGFGVPTVQVESAARGSLIAYGGGLLLSLVIGLLAALRIARSINRPMADLRRAAQAVGRGEQPEPTHTVIREIQEVSNALLVSSQQRAHSEIEREELLKREQAARALAEAANRAKDEFLAMLGHELRNPLGAVANAVTLLQRSDVDEATRRSSVGIISRQVSHLSRLTDDLLDAARALMGKIVLQKRPVNLATAVDQCLHALRAAGRTKAHRIDTRLAEVWVEVDPIRLDQVVTNLLVNALKYTPPGGHIRLVVERVGPDAVLRVVDDGIGMSPALKERVFDIFVQGDRDLDRAQGGLGIGLTLVRRLVEMHGGSVTAASEGEGRGSEFCVTLSAIEAPAEAAIPAARPGVTARRIVLVEDNDDARETLSELLRLGGHSVETASDGEAGLQVVLSVVPDVALVDIGLPKMDGYEVARRVRAAIDGDKRPYLVALTGYGLPEDRRRALDAGFDAHMVKPVDNVLLDEVLQNFDLVTG